MDKAVEPLRFQALRNIFALMMREMSSTFGRSPGGYFWAIAEPVGIIVMLAIGFSLVVRAPALGNNFILFYATGYLPYSLFATLARVIMHGLGYSRPLLAYPRVSWIEALFARLFLHSLTNFAVSFIVLGAILMLEDTRIKLDFMPILNGYAMLVLTGFALGMMNCFLMGLFPVWENIWTIVNRPLFLASGIFFLFDDLPKAAQSILWFNPILHAIGEVRRGFYATYDPAYISPTYVYGLALALLAFALLLLKRHYRWILEE
ncbi:ABC transporter permease [Celeribacter ethanolicus]|nr:ABC transporter permease [Celeribacter ethanolicus]